MYILWVEDFEYMALLYLQVEVVVHVVLGILVYIHIKQNTRAHVTTINVYAYLTIYVYVTKPGAHLFKICYYFY